MNAAGLFWKRSRIAAGFSQIEVAQALGYSTSQYISNFERGVCSLSHKIVPTLIELYGVDRGEVFNVLVEEQRQQIAALVNKKGQRSKRKKESA